MTNENTEQAAEAANSLARSVTLSANDIGAFPGPRPTAPALTPSEWLKKHRNRRTKFGKVHMGEKLEKSMLASNLVAGPASIPELARALKNDVDLINEWVYSNVDYYPMFGVHRGPQATIIDANGNDMEQARLMVALLRQAGYTATFVRGVRRLTKAELDQLYDTAGITDPVNLQTFLINTQIPFILNLDQGQVVTADLTHVWVKVNIGGTNYYFDPSYKTYVYKAINSNLATAVNFNEAALIAAAESGATVTADSITNFNRLNVKDKFKEYGTNLLNWIRNFDFDASMDDILGGRTIQPLSGTPIRNLTPPRQSPAFPDLTEYTADLPITSPPQTPGDPNVFAIYRVAYPDFPAPGYIDFAASAVYGQRLTLTFNENNQSELRLNGALIVQGSGLPESDYQIDFTIFHPFYDTNIQTSTWSRTIHAPGTYFLGTSYGPMSQGMADRHQQLMQQFQAQGLADDSEAVLGESLATLFFQHVSQQTKISDTFEKIGKAQNFVWHFSGIVEKNDITPCAVINLSGRNNFFASKVEDEALAFKAWTGHEFMVGALEGAIMQQRFPSIGVDTVSLLDKAIELGQTVYDATQANYLSSVRPNLFGYPVSIGSQIDAQILTDNRRLILHANGSTSVGSAVGAGWLGAVITGPTQTGLAGFLWGQFKGGFASEPNFGIVRPTPILYATPMETQPVTFDPITLQTGDLLYNRTDFSVGSSAFPYSLDFGRSYSSANRAVDGPLGKGWTHNHASSLQVTSNGSRGIGEVSVKEAAGTIAYAYVLTQLALNNANSPNLTKMLIGCISSLWLSDQLTNNAVVLSAGGSSYNFIKLVDDTFNPPPGEARTLIKNVDGTYTLKTPQQLAWNFGTNGKVTSFVDPAGVTVDYFYNSGTGLLESVTNGLGRTLTFSYTGTRLTSVSDGNGRSVSYAVDSNGNLVSFSDPLGHTHTFEYVLPGQLTKIYLPKNPTIAIVENTYDTLGRLKTQKGADTGTYNYFFAGSRSEEVDPDLNRHIMYWNKLGSLVRNIDALGHETVTEYDGLNRPTKITMPEGNSVSMVYDNKNNVLSTTAKAKLSAPAPDIVNSFTFDPVWNKVATATDGRGNTTNFDYDNTTGRLLSIVQPPPQVGDPNPTTVFTYNLRGQLETATDPTGIVSKNTFDGSTEKLLSTVYDFGTSPHLNLTSSFDYNPVGDVISVTDPRGNTSTFTIDEARRLIQSVTPAVAPALSGFVTNFGFDVNDQGTSVQRQTGLPSPNQWQTSTSAYTITGMIDFVTNPSGHVTDYVYDTMNRLLKTIDPESRTLEYSYDELSRVSTVKDPANVIAGTRTYTPNGRLASMKDARNNVTTAEYDGFDRLSKRIYPDASFEEMTFDENGNVLTTRTRAGQIISMTYDALNRKLTKSPAGMPTQTMEYDLSGRMKKISTPVISGDPTSGDFEFFFDTAGRLIQQKKPDGKTVNYVLDSNGNRTKLTYPDGYFVDYAFDVLNRLTDIKLNGSSSSAAVFQYNDLSNRTKLTYGNSCVVDYGYEIDDDMNSLTHSFVGSSVNFGYTFDAIHQVKDQFVSNDDFMWDAVVDATTNYEEPGFPINSLNQYTKVGGAAYSYDGNGCLTSNGPWSYGYDTLNRLTSATIPGVNVSFLYDPMNRQGEKNVGGVKTRFLYDGLRRIEDYDGSGALLNRFVYGTGLDEPLIQVSGGGTLKYLHQDRQSSLIASTDASGAVLTRNAYGPFGETGTVSGLPAGYTGQRFDAETGLYYCKSRYYSPTIGRFLQPDPIGYGAGMNLYAYVGNTPISLSDPLGLSPFMRLGVAPKDETSPKAGKSMLNFWQVSSPYPPNPVQDDGPGPFIFFPDGNKGAGSGGSGAAGGGSGGKSGAGGAEGEYLRDKPYDYPRKKDHPFMKWEPGDPIKLSKEFAQDIRHFLDAFFWDNHINDSAAYNAARHALAAALVTRQFGNNVPGAMLAEILGAGFDAYEATHKAKDLQAAWDRISSRDTAIDIANNAAGTNIAHQNPSMSYQSLTVTIIDSARSNTIGGVIQSR